MSLINFAVGCAKMFYDYDSEIIVKYFVFKSITNGCKLSIISEEKKDLCDLLAKSHRYSKNIYFQCLDEEKVRNKFETVDMFQNSSLFTFLIIEDFTNSLKDIPLLNEKELKIKDFLTLSVPERLLISKYSKVALVNK